MEEWFYALFPLAMYMFYRLLNRNFHWAITLSIFSFFVLPLISRFVLASNITDYGAFDANIRSIVVNRLDSIMIGVLAAYIAVRRPGQFQSWRKLMWPAILLVGLLAWYISKGLPNLVGNQFLMAVFFPFLSITIAVTLPGLVNMSTPKSYWIKAPIEFTSKISYSLYLGHICVLTLVNDILGRLGIGAAPGFPTLMVYAMYFLGYYVIAYLSYTYVEQPFMRLRDSRIRGDDLQSGPVALRSTTRSDR